MPRPADAVTVPTGLHWQSRFFAATAAWWQRLGQLETRLLADELQAVDITAPIYVTSLARAGTTIVTEMLAAHPEVTCHRYSDFPNLWTPYWRNWLLQRSRTATPPLVERAHKDRILVNNDSPEAVEEILWNRFFAGLHDERHSNELTADHRQPEFDRFYTEHLQKLLLVRSAGRYLSKGNYNISRLKYLLDLFPDAKILIPVRHPVNHIASLAKQHRYFSQAHQQDSRVGTQLALAGHWEFGPYRKLVNFGDDPAAAAIRAAWNNGEEVRGWARYWVSTYEYLNKLIKELGSNSNNLLIFQYEQLCATPEPVIDRILEHAGLPPEPYSSAKRHYAANISLPQYYRPDFSEPEQKLIQTICAPTAEKFGYQLG